MTMESVSVAKLKSKLSQYLKVVKNGKQIIVTSHRHPIARLGPLEARRPSTDIIPAIKPVVSLKKIKGIKLRIDPVAYLLADRRRR
jgi:prevent-host-death family protein